MSLTSSLVCAVRVLLSALAMVYAYLVMFVWIIHDGAPNLYDYGAGRLLLPMLASYRSAAAATPFVRLATGSVVVKSVFNACLVFFFGFCHSLFAREFTRRFFVKTIGVPVYMYRTLFMTVTAAAFFNIVANWNYVDVVVVNLRPVLYAVGATDAGVDKWEPFARFLLHLACLQTVFKLDVFSFVGLRQAFTKRTEDDAEASTPLDNPELQTTGIYGWVRHPMYMWLLAVVACTSVITLDRVVLFAAMTAYLTFALPWEEAKLIDQFGAAYVRYQQEVPMLFPGWPMPGVRAKHE